MEARRERAGSAAAYRCGGKNVPPMGGKRTLKSIKKQSVPHMLALYSSRMRVLMEVTETVVVR